MFDFSSLSKIRNSYKNHTYKTGHPPVPVLGNIDGPTPCIYNGSIKNGR